MDIFEVLFINEEIKAYGKQLSFIWESDGSCLKENSLSCTGTKFHLTQFHSIYIKN